MLWFGRHRRRRLRRKPLPRRWREILERTVPGYAELGESERRRLHGHVRVFLDDKVFEGAGGLEITDEIRVTIAAQACLLLVGRDVDRVYPGLKSIIVYPRAYVATGRSVGPAGVVTESTGTRAGESWSHAFGASPAGPVVLAWDEVRRGAMDPDDAHNVVYHEFAHQLDAEATGVDGAPALGDAGRFAAWARVLGEEFEDLRDRVASGMGADLRAYGATSPAEFFAVATEAFFERPGDLAAHRPALYEQLRGFYGWTPPGGPGRAGGAKNGADR